MRWSLPERWQTGWVFMADGVVVEEGKPEEFFTNPKNERTIQFLRKTLSPDD